MIAWLASINLLVLLFNLLPAFPMDGGRIVRAIAWWRTGDRTSATRFAANLGRVFGYIFIGGGLLLVFSGADVFGGVWLALIGIVINSSRPRRLDADGDHRAGSSDLRVSDVMDREPVAIPGELSVEQALDEYFLRYRWPWFPVVDAAHQLPRAGRPRQSRRGARGLPRQLAMSPTCSSRTTAPSRSATTPRWTRCWPTGPAPLRRADGRRRRRPALGRDHRRAAGRALRDAS